MRSDCEFIRFISGDDVKFLSNPAAYDGSKRWGTALRGCTIPWESDDETSKMVNILGEELDSVKKCLKHMLEVSKKHAEVTAAYSESWRAVGSSLREWKLVETDEVTVANGTMSTEDSVILLTSTFQDLAKTYPNIITTEHRGLEQTNRILVDAIRFEPATVESWKEEIGVIEKMLSSKAKAIAALKKVRDEHEALVNAQAQNASNAKPDKVIACAAREQEALSALEASSEKLLRKVKGTMVIELENYRRHRTRRMASLSAKWKASMAIASDRMCDCWQKATPPSPSRPTEKKQVGDGN